MPVFNRSRSDVRWLGLGSGSGLVHFVARAGFANHSAEQHIY